MSVQCSPFGTLPDGREVEQWTLSGNGLTVALITYGAAIQSLQYGGRDMVLGFERIEDYLQARCPYIGTIVGRYANRLSGGELTVSGRSHPLDCNEGMGVQLHGGKTGLHQILWTAQKGGTAAPSIIMTAKCGDMEGGCPGRIEIRVTYTLLPKAKLRLEYEAVCDEDTEVNLTSHAFFNLSGIEGSDIRKHCLEIYASRYLPVDSTLIPLGEGVPVDESPFDFRPEKAGHCEGCQPVSASYSKTIEAHLDPSHPQIGLSGGIDHNFCIDGQGFRPAAKVLSPESGLSMICSTDQPGLQIYLGQGLDESAGKNGVPISAYTGLCLETQHYPDSPRHPSYPSTFLKAGEVFRSITEYQFFSNGLEI